MALLRLLNISDHDKRISVPFSLLLVVALVLLTVKCGSAPGEPEIVRGGMRVEAYMSDFLSDSILVMFDDNSLGYYANPCEITGLLPGSHKVAGHHRGAFSVPQMVNILPDEITNVTLQLEGEIPFPGGTAPDFTGTDLFGNQISYSEHQGKVILLVFFTHT